MNVSCALSRPARWGRTFAWVAFALPALAAAQVSGTGLRGDGEWSPWQGRLGLTSGSAGVQAGGRDDLGLSSANRYDGGGRQSLSLFGDYYFLQQGLPGNVGYSGGLRATGGLIYGPRSVAWAALPSGVAGLGTGFSTQRRSFSLANSTYAIDDNASTSVPYLGVGYTGLSALRATGGGWGFSADLGIVALQPRSAVRFGQQGLMDTLRDLQLSPLLQLGVSYSF